MSTPRLPAELAVGYPEIDEQHRTLLARIGDAVGSARADDLAATKTCLSTLGGDLVAHFAAEEGAMTASQYPERGRHKAAHDLFMQDFLQLTRELEQCGLSVPVLEWIVTRIPEWVKFHIQVNDVPLGRYLAARRFAAEAASAIPVKPRAS